MATIFSKIVQGELPCYKVAENEKFLAFLDIAPLQKGHTLVILKEEVDYIFDIQDNTLAEMMLFVKSVSKAIQKTISCNRIGVAIVGLEVPHAHIHLIPINHADDMNFANPKLKLSTEEHVEIAHRISNKIKM
jgi:histidine triad (HIT) family protein